MDYSFEVLAETVQEWSSRFVVGGLRSENKKGSAFL
jgi:hypothetical protein